MEPERARAIDQRVMGLARVQRDLHLPLLMGKQKALHLGPLGARPRLRGRGPNG